MENPALELQKMAIKKWSMNMPMTQEEYNAWLDKLLNSPPQLATAGQSEFMGIMDRFNGVCQQIQHGIQERVKQLNVPVQ